MMMCMWNACTIFILSVLNCSCYANNIKFGQSNFSFSFNFVNFFLFRWFWPLLQLIASLQKKNSKLQRLSSIQIPNTEHFVLFAFSQKMIKRRNRRGCTTVYAHTIHVHVAYCCWFYSYNYYYYWFAGFS